MVVVVAAGGGLVGSGWARGEGGICTNDREGLDQEIEMGLDAEGLVARGQGEHGGQGVVGVAEELGEEGLVALGVDGGEIVDTGQIYSGTGRGGRGVLGVLVGGGQVGEGGAG